MTLLEMRSAVFDNTRREDKSGLVDRSINLAIREIVQIKPFNLLRGEVTLVLSASQNQITLPDGINQISNVRLFNEVVDQTTQPAVNSVLAYDIVILDPVTLRKMFPNLAINVQGRPQYCMIENGVMTFVPPTFQDRTVSIEVDATAPTLVEDDDENPIPDTDNAVICWSTHYVFKSIGMYQDATIWWQSYQDALTKAMRNNSRKPHQRRIMQGAWPKTRGNIHEYNENIYTR